MSAMHSSRRSVPQGMTIDTWRKQLDCLFLLSQLNMKTDSYISNRLNSMGSTAPVNNYNNSSVSIENDRPFYLSHSPIASVEFPNNRLLKERRKSSNNSSRKTRNRRSKQHRWKSNQYRKMNKNEQLETENFRSRNMITVRRISCHQILHPDNKIPLENQKMKNQREFVRFHPQ